MEEKKKVIKNITPEELRNKLEESSIQAIPINKNTEVNSFNLKPKKSKYEPDPVKFYLPSGNLFIEEGFIWIRRLSTNEESMLMSFQTESDFNSVLNKIFDSSIKSDINIDSIPLIDKVAIFSGIIGITYGSNISIKNEVSEKCSMCTKNNNVSFDVLQDVKYDYIDRDTFQYPFSIITEDNVYQIKFRYPCIKDENSLENFSLNFIKKIVLEIRELKNNLLLDKKDFDDIIDWLSSNDKKKISIILKDLLAHGNEFKINISQCSVNNCGMKGKEIEFRSEDLLAKIVNSIIENLSI